MRTNHRQDQLEQRANRGVPGNQSELIANPTQGQAMRFDHAGQERPSQNLQAAFGLQCVLFAKNSQHHVRTKEQQQPIAADK